MTDEAQQTSYGLLVAFPDESPSFVHGFEAGQLWERMRGGHEAEIEVTTHVENREVIARMADSCGFDLETEPSGTEGWYFTKLTKVRPERERPNPHGLRVVSAGRAALSKKETE